MKKLLTILFLLSVIAVSAQNKVNLKLPSGSASNKSSTFYANVAAMQADNPADGVQVTTLGYNTKGDGGGATYYYSASSTATVDGGSVIAPSNNTGRYLAVFGSTINIKQFSGLLTGGNNWTTAFYTATKYLQDNGGGILRIPAGTFYADSILIRNKVSIVGDNELSTVLRTLPSSKTSFFILDRGRVDGIEMKNFAVYDFVNTGENAFDLTAHHPLNNNTADGGFWYSKLENIRIQGFGGKSINLYCSDNLDSTGGADIANQFLTFINVKAFCRNVSGARPLYIEGQLGQAEFINCEFDGVFGVTAATNTTSVEIKGIPGSNDQITGSVNFRGCTFQYCNKVANIDDALGVSFFAGWIEGVNTGIYVTNKSHVTIENMRWGAKSPSDVNGYLVNKVNSFVTFKHNTILDDWRVSGYYFPKGLISSPENGESLHSGSSNGGWDIAGNNYTNLAQSMPTSSITYTDPTVSFNSITVGYNKLAFLRTSITDTMPVKTINSQLTTGDELVIEGLGNNNTEYYYRLITTGGNISIPHQYGDTIVLRNRDILVLEKTDISSVPWVVKSFTGVVRKGIAAPTTGYWLKGERFENTAYDSTNALGWLCVATGSPGTWIASNNYTDAEKANIARNNTAQTITASKAYSTTGDFSLYNTTDQTTNFERFHHYWSSNNYYIAGELGGSGSGRSIILQTAGGRSLTIFNAPQIYGTINVNSGTSASASLFGMTGTYNSTNGIQNGLVDARVINQTGTAGYRSLWVTVYEQSLGSGIHNLIDVGTNSAATAAGTHTSKFAVDNKGKITIATGTNASVGTATLVSGTVTVSTTAVSASSLIYITLKTPSGTLGFLQQGTIVAGTSFVINSLTSAGAVNTADNSTVNWWIIN